MESELITKRLHISGLTPSITAAELSRRLSTFGTVKGLDGFGKLDALDQPRKFAYVTLEGSKAQLAKCVNVLSGSTWKGTKLRIGDAKPDYQQRIAKELAADPAPPTKKRRRAVCVHAPDMSLVTPSNVSERKGWKITPMGRMVRPIRMRPDRPLPPPTLGRNKKGKDGKEKKKRVKEPDVRARRRTIDPTKWDSVLLKGMFLDMISANVGSRDLKVTSRNSENESESGDSSDGSSSGGESTKSDSHAAISNLAEPIPSVSPPPLSPLSPKQASSSFQTKGSPNVNNIDLTHEKVTSLSLLHSLFGSRDDDWEGKESLGSDIGEEDVERLKKEGGRTGGADASGLDGHGEVEEVPMDVDNTNEEPANEDEEIGEPQQIQDVTKPESVVEQRIEQPVQKTNLKDLFAPREEDAGFSLLGHLDLEFELDDEIDILGFAPSHPAPANEQTAAPTQAAIFRLPTQSSRASQFTYNPSLPLFFPHFDSLSFPDSNSRHKDLFTVARERGWDPVSARFYRTNTEDEIRQQWEEAKGELTREWKRRYREAGKVRRRGGGNGD